MAARKLRQKQISALSGTLNYISNMKKIRHVSLGGKFLTFLTLSLYTEKNNHAAAVQVLYFEMVAEEEQYLLALMNRLQRET